jgi:hypothetical protein
VYRSRCCGVFSITSFIGYCSYTLLWIIYLLGLIVVAMFYVYQMFDEGYVCGVFDVVTGRKVPEELLKLVGVFDRPVIAVRAVRSEGGYYRVFPRFVDAFCNKEKLYINLFL